MYLYLAFCEVLVIWEGKLDKYGGLFAGRTNSITSSPIMTSPPSIKTSPPSIMTNPPSLMTNPPSLMTSPPSIMISRPPIMTQKQNSTINPRQSHTISQNQNTTYCKVWINVT